jgi:hypothetical protein
LVTTDMGEFTRRQQGALLVDMGFDERQRQIPTVGINISSRPRATRGSDGCDRTAGDDDVGFKYLSGVDMDHPSNADRDIIGTRPATWPSEKISVGVGGLWWQLLTEFLWATHSGTFGCDAEGRRRPVIPLPADPTKEERRMPPGAERARPTSEETGVLEASRPTH